MECGVQGFDAPTEESQRIRVIGHPVTGRPAAAQHRSGATAGEELVAVLRWSASAEGHDPFLIRHTQRACGWHGVANEVCQTTAELHLLPSP